MASTFPHPRPSLSPAEKAPAWRRAGLRYYSYGYFLRSRYGRRVWRISLDGGFTCPNIDGTVAYGGCTFCDNRSFSPSRRVRRREIALQIERGIAALRRRYGDRCEAFIAYFQPGTNTHAPVDRLRPLFEEAASDPRIVGLAIGTRPDAVDEPVLDLLTELAGRLPVSVEYGMQTMHDASLEAMNRGHDHATLVRAVERTRGRGIQIGLHLLIGWPTESRAQVMASADEVARLQVDSVKLHSLYAVHGTPLGDQVLRGDVTLLDQATYVDWAVEILERLPPDTVIERLVAHAPPEYLIGPAWCLQSAVVRAEIERELARRDTFQGARCIHRRSCGPPSVVRRSIQSPRV